MNRLAWRWEILNTGIPHFRTVWMYGGKGTD